MGEVDFHKCNERLCDGGAIFTTEGTETRVRGARKAIVDGEPKRLFNRKTTPRGWYLRIVKVKKWRVGK